MSTDHGMHGCNWGWHASKALCLCKDRGSPKLLWWERNGGELWAGRKTQALAHPCPSMFSILAQPGCPLHLSLDCTHGNTRQMDLFSPSFLPYFLIQKVKCSSNTESIFLLLSFIHGRQLPVCRGYARDKNTPCIDPARLESHCLPGANLQPGHSSGVSHIRDQKCQPGLLAKQQPKTTQ